MRRKQHPILLIAFLFVFNAMLLLRLAALVVAHRQQVAVVATVDVAVPARRPQLKAQSYPQFAPPTPRRWASD